MKTNNLPPPTAFGAPSKFDKWRPYQQEAVSKAIEESKARFIVQVQPTGSGKSLCYIMAAVLSGKRALILTSTKALQDQVMSDFGKAFNIADVRGQAGYMCLADVNGMLTVEEGPCHAGMACGMREMGCRYYDAVRDAARAKIVVTNYAFWLTSARSNNSIGTFDLLILDEAHDAPEWTMKALSAAINESDIKYDMKCELPEGEDIDKWKEWALNMGVILDNELDNIKLEYNRGAKVNQSRAARIRKYARAVDNICVIAKNNMVVDRKTVNGHTLVEPITARGLAEPLLFRNTPKVILTSATIRPKTMWMLGLSEKDQKEGTLRVEEYPSQFETWRRPVIYVPTVRVQYDMTEQEVKMWIIQMDNIIRGRLDRKGIIHSVSYQRMKEIMLRSEFRQRMIAHESRTLNHAIKKFKEMPPPCVLVSPSVTTGYDFPMDGCEYQILSKVSFPDSRSSSMKARVKDDKEYAYYITMQNIVQASGRGMRSMDDQCEVFVVDDHWRWFINRYGKFAPKWFMEACKTVRTVPYPPPKLRKG